MVGCKHCWLDWIAMWILVIVFLYNAPDKVMEMTTTYKEQYSEHECIVRAAAWKLILKSENLALEDGTVPTIITRCKQKT